MTFTPRSEAAHPRSRSRRSAPCAAVRAGLPLAAVLGAALTLLLGLVPAAPAAADGAETAATDPAPGIEAAADPIRHVRIPMDRLANFDRLRRDLSNEATVEDLLEDGDRRDLTAVRAWVERCKRVQYCELQDDPHQFADGRHVLQDLAKESLRDYVKREIRWTEMQDRMKVRVSNFFLGSRDAGAATADPTDGPGAFEFAPQVDLDLDDTELGVDFRYAPARYRFLADWELSYREHVQRPGRSLRLRYDGEERWFDLTTAMDDDYLGNYVGFTVTQLF